MSNIQQIVEEIDALVKTGSKLLSEANKEIEKWKVNISYEAWYTKSLSVIRQVIPERTEDFCSLYRNDKRKEINASTYTIRDFLHGTRITQAGREQFNAQSVYQSKLTQQFSILNAASSIAPSVLRDFQTTLQLELFDNDIEAAKELATSGQLRSAGVICGVVLERHLKSVASRRSVTGTKKRPTLGDLNDLLKQNSIYDVSLWRLIQRLADIRNLCAHAGEREPKKDEVEDMISGTDKILKEVS